MRRFFFWRVAGLFAFLSMLTIGGCTLAFWVAVASLEQLSLPRGALPFLFFTSFVAGVVGLALVGRAFRRAALPVGDLMEAAGRVETGDYGVRVAERGPREVRALVRAFNAMAARLQKDEAQRRNLLADVTHELRTPLTVIQGQLEGVVDGVYPADEAHLAPLLEETRVLARLIDDLRILALAESGALKLHREPTDLGVLVNETVASFRAQAGSAGVQLSVTLPAELPLMEIDPVRIREVLANLIANALQHTPHGGTIGVAGDVEASSRRVAISVGDTGTGIPAEALPHVFDRFYKSHESRGSGLGLTIAKDLVAAHGGEISARSDGAPGRGTTIRFTLPQAVA